MTYLGVDRKTAEQVNVRGVEEVLELARACRSLECLVHYSTTQVAGDRTGLVREEDLEQGQTFRTIVAETRARAEKAVRRCMPQIPIAVVRPTTIIGDSDSGEVDRFDGPYLLILLIVTSPAEIAVPLPGRGDAPLHLVPIDYVVRAAHAIGRSAAAPGRTFHLVDPHPLTAKRVFELVARAGGRPSPRGFIPTNLTKALLRTPGLERFAKSPRAFVERLQRRSASTPGTPRRSWPGPASPAHPSSPTSTTSSPTCAIACARSANGARPPSRASWKTIRFLEHAFPRASICYAAHLNGESTKLRTKLRSSSRARSVSAARARIESGSNPSSMSRRRLSIRRSHA